jgi:electron transfer flavoprotein beta subunit
MSKPIRIIVCVKQVIDPEAPAASFKIDSENQKISAEGVPPVLSPYDESALELALRMKDARPDVRIAAVSFGPKLARPVLMKTLAVGADELYMIEGQAIADTHVTAAVLASLISGMGFDIILAGRQAADTNSGCVGLALATRLNIPSVSWARKVDVEDDKLIVERVIPDGYETLRGSMPALVTVSHEAGSLRLPKLQDIKKAKEKPIHNLRLDDLKLDPFPNPLTSLIRLEAPLRRRHCRLIEADTPSDAATQLAQTLIRAGVL